METAGCFATSDPANPDGCAFVEQEAVNLDDLALGEWVLNNSRDAVDVNNDGNRDLLLLTIATGGNSAVPVSVVYGNGDGTFEPPVELFSHNSDSCGASPANSILFADFDSDELGDVILGFDDDGDAGSGWFYPGALTGVSTDGAVSFDFDTSGCFEALDINTTHESGGEHPGVSSSARNFDFDFDGIQDIMLGYNYESAWAPPSNTELWLGNGDGSFSFSSVVRDYADSNYASTFAIPQPMCLRFATTEEEDEEE